MANLRDLYENLAQSAAATSPDPRGSTAVSRWAEAVTAELISAKDWASASTETHRKLTTLVETLAEITERLIDRVEELEKQVGVSA